MWLSPPRRGSGKCAGRDVHHCDTEEFTYYSGTQIDSITFSDSDWRACCRACGNEPECVRWDFNLDSFVCKLRSTDGAATVDKSFIAGIAYRLSPFGLEPRECHKEAYALCRFDRPPFELDRPALGDQPGTAAECEL